jgi:hypothetical protein
MGCNCNISISYTVYIDPDTIDVAEFTLTPSAGLYNDQSFYTWTDELLNQSFILRWNGLSWEIVTEIGEIECSKLLSPLALICPVQGDIDNNWEDQEGSPLFHVITYSTCEVAPVCLSWNNTESPEVPTFWKDYILVFDELQNASNFYIGQAITYFSYNVPIAPGTGVYYITAIFYTDGVNIFTENGPGRTIYGIALIDSSGYLVLTIARVPNSGYLCVEPAYETPEEVNKECFDILVWNKQCEFAQCVLNYSKLLKFGIAPCDMLDNLKNKRRVLEILNCYDTRDIENNTTDYNVLTYSQIKKLLNS